MAVWVVDGPLVANAGGYGQIPQGGGMTDAGRERRERVRIQATQWFADCDSMGLRRLLRLHLYATRHSGSAALKAVRRLLIASTGR